MAESKREREAGSEPLGSTDHSSRREAFDESLDRAQAKPSPAKRVPSRKGIDAASDYDNLSPSENFQRAAFDQVLMKEWSNYEKIVRDNPSLYRAMSSIFKKYIIEMRRAYTVSVPEMRFSGEEEFISYIIHVAEKAEGSPLFDSALPSAVKGLLQSYFDKAKGEILPPVPERKYIPHQDEIIPFLREVWGEWIACGKLSRQVLTAHDESALSAFTNWQRKYGVPDDIKVLTNQEVVSQNLEREWFHRDEVPRIASALSRRNR